MKTEEKFDFDDQCYIKILETPDGTYGKLFDKNGHLTMLQKVNPSNIALAITKLHEGFCKNGRNRQNKNTA